MPSRATSRVRIVAVAVLLLVLAVAAVEALHGTHGDAEGSVVSTGCATCIALRAPVASAMPPIVGPAHLAAGEWFAAPALSDPLRGAARPAVSRGPPSHA